MNDIAQALMLARNLGVDRLDAQLLLLHAIGAAPADIGTRRAWLLAHDDEAVDAGTVCKFEHSLRRRLAGEPLAYITGYKEFFGLGLGVDARVLVPRADTETLVAWALELLAGPIATGFAPPAAVLDLGTGSGAIALALKHTRPEIQVDAVDASLDALKVACANAARLGLEVQFSHGSWLDQVKRHYHCIVANPPYVAADDPHMRALTHEPVVALVSGPDGLQDIRHIVTAAKARLYDGGWLLVEHGFDQAERVHNLFAQAGYRQIESKRDLGGNTRCTGGSISLTIPLPAAIDPAH